jgi:protein required for attachment to host cells
MKPLTTWILIADGARARVLENTGPGKGVAEVAGLEFADEHLRSSDIMADKPGRAFSSAGEGRSAMEPSTDPVQKRQSDFARRLAETLEKKRRQKAFDRLVLVAAPAALGHLRSALTPQLREAVSGELAKDLTKVPNPDIPKHLMGVLAV